MDRELKISLKEIRARITQVDPLLVQLINLAVQGSVPIQYGIAVRLGGATIHGIPSLASATGEILDEQTVRFVQVMHAISLTEGAGNGSWPEMEKQVRDAAMFTNRARRGDEAYGKLLDYLAEKGIDRMPEITEMPDELVDTAIVALAPPKALTLTNAVIEKDNGTSENIENIRINLSAVEAWWTFELGVPEPSQEALARIRRKS
jgi:hypothetical protein